MTCEHGYTFMFDCPICLCPVCDRPESECAPGCHEDECV